MAYSVFHYDTYEQSQQQDFNEHKNRGVTEHKGLFDNSPSKANGLRNAMLWEQIAKNTKESRCPSLPLNRLWEIPGKLSCLAATSTSNIRQLSNLKRLLSRQFTCHLWYTQLWTWKFITGNDTNRTWTKANGDMKRTGYCAVGNRPA